MTIRLCTALAVGGLTAALATAADSDGVHALSGFSPQGSTQQQSLEQRFDAELSAAELRGWL